ncbi:PDRG1 [Bugula neritina]|uniref:PDRG1 n=1 Tax=Bugula neritina TaxID=10212 RepID=A0A7J7JZR5_BUGNE|nr:PDRG1 [Bugula neritina]
MAFDTNKLLEQLTAVEYAAQDLLEERQSIVALDRTRNHTREARTALKHIVSDRESLANHGSKTWMCFGNTFIKMKNDTALKLLNESHLKLDREIEKSRNGLRDKLNNVRELEGNSHAAGFNLKALSPDEQKALNRLL